jgi:hypothetical protein
MPTIIFLDFWEKKKIKKIIQYDSFDKIPVMSKNGTIEIKGKVYKILSKKKISKSDFTDHHKTSDNEIYEVLVERI